MGVLAHEKITLRSSTAWKVLDGVVRWHGSAQGEMSGGARGRGGGGGGTSGV